MKHFNFLVFDTFSHKMVLNFDVLQMTLKCGVLGQFSYKLIVHNYTNWLEIFFNQFTKKISQLDALPSYKCGRDILSFTGG